MNKPKDNVKNLLAAIQRQTPKAPMPTPVAEVAIEPVVEALSVERSKPSKRAVKPKESRAGKAVQFWMYDDERKLVREFSAWIAGQGVRPSDSVADWISSGSISSRGVADASWFYAERPCLHERASIQTGGPLSAEIRSADLRR
jgi:hypothetical protein